MHIIDKIQEALDNNMPFVAYRKPQSKDVLAFFQENSILYTTDDYVEKGFVFAPFDDAKSSVLIPAKFSYFIKEEFNKIDEVPNGDFISQGDEFRDFHINIVKKGVEAIKEGCFKKVVLSRKETISKNGTTIVNTFRNLLNSYSNAFVYVWSHPKVGLWMGATPETLIKIDGNSFETMSLAGTQVYEKDKEVCWESKEIDEQQLVTDYVLQKLKTVCETVNGSEVETIKAGNLLHLKTVIKGGFTNKASELITILHPTPAVCGYPKDAAKKFILEKEKYDRGFYTGFLGELNMPKSELFVNLRCMEISRNSVSIYVGGGITKESDAVKEWEETVAKSKTMKRAL